MPYCYEDYVEEFPEFFNHDKPPKPYKMFEIILEKLTPQSFLSDVEFEKHKNSLFVRGAEPNYPANKLSEAGMELVYKEIQRLSEVYRKTYKDHLSANEFLGLYLYTTNLGYRGMNTQLRTGQGTEYTTMIKFAQRGLNILSKIPEFQHRAESETERTTVIRFMNLPATLLAKIVDQAQATKTFKDLAFLSTSTDPGGASAFKGNITMSINTRGKSLGARLEGISPFAAEKELLVLPASKLTVQEVINDGTEENPHITLKLVAQDIADVFDVTFTSSRMIDRLHSHYLKRVAGKLAEEAEVREAKSAADEAEDNLRYVMALVDSAKATFSEVGTHNQADHLVELMKTARQATEGAKTAAAKAAHLVTSKGSDSPSQKYAKAASDYAAQAEIQLRVLEQIELKTALQVKEEESFVAPSSFKHS